MVIYYLEQITLSLKTTFRRFKKNRQKLGKNKSLGHSEENVSD